MDNFYKILEHFINLLNMEARSLERMANVLQNERDAIIHSAMDALRKAGGEKEELHEALGKLEKQRLEMQEKIVGFIKILPGDLTVTKLSGLVDEPYSIRLKECASNLAGLLNRINEANRLNKSLLAGSLELVRGSISLFNNLTVSNQVYYRTGMIQGDNTGGKVLSGKI